MNIKNDSLSISVNNNISVVGGPRKSCYYVERKVSISNLHSTWNQMGSNKGLNSEKKPRRKKSLFNSAKAERINPYGWMTKPTELWDKSDSINWLLWAATVLGQAYGQISPYLAMPGNELLRLKQQDFIKYDPHFGGKLHDLLYEGRDSNVFRSSQVPSSNAMETDSGSETSVTSDDDFPGRESAVNMGPTKKPRSKRPVLPIFIRNLLFDSKYYEWIRWENYEEKSFRFVKGDRVAELWGKLNEKTNMDYEKLTRAIRYWYDPSDEDNGILAPHLDRLVYKFGKSATLTLELETDNLYSLF